jgi:hypothetical protein
MFYDLFKDYKELQAETLTSSCFMNDGKGSFKRMNLPEELQLAPLFSFAPALSGNTNKYIAVGNFYGVVPYEGRYDALIPTIVSFNKSQSLFTVASQLPSLQQEMRDAKWLNYTNGTKILVLAVNNGPLIFLKPTVQ